MPFCVPFFNCLALLLIFTSLSPLHHTVAQELPAASDDLPPATNPGGGNIQQIPADQQNQKVGPWNQFLSVNPTTSTEAQLPASGVSPQIPDGEKPPQIPGDPHLETPHPQPGATLNQLIAVNPPPAVPEAPQLPAGVEIAPSPPPPPQIAPSAVVEQPPPPTEGPPKSPADWSRFLFPTPASVIVVLPESTATPSLPPSPPITNGGIVAPPTPTVWETFINSNNDNGVTVKPLSPPPPVLQTPEKPVPAPAAPVPVPMPNFPPSTQVILSPSLAPNGQLQMQQQQNCGCCFFCLPVCFYTLYV